MINGLCRTPKDDSGGDGSTQYNGKPLPFIQHRYGIFSTDSIFRNRMKIKHQTTQEHQQCAYAEQPAELVDDEIVDGYGRFKECLLIHNTIGQCCKQQNECWPEYFVSEF